MLDVYKTRYKLKGEPFRLSPDHHFPFAHPSYANAEAYLKYAISQGEGFIAITGGPGSGKTTLVNALLAGLDETRIQVAMLRNAQLDPGNLVRMVLDAFDLPFEDANTASPVSELEQFLKQQSQKGHRAVLIVDEAQGLSSAALEELRLLSNLQHDNRLLLQVVLVGQEQLLDRVHATGMKHLQQRLIAASHLEPLDLDETVSYVEQRLCHVGWQGDPAISEDALRLIHKFSEGVPRRINLICHRLFLYGGLQQKHELVGEDARHVIDELYKERVLAPELPGEHSLAETSVAKSRGTGLPALNLPRSKSFAQAGKPRQRSMQADSEAAAADNIIPLARPVSPVPQDEINESSARPPNERNRQIRTADKATSESLPLESGTGPEKHRRWRLAAGFGVLTALVLVVAVNTELGDQQDDLMLAAPAETKNRIATVETASEKKEAIAPDPELVSATNSPDRPPVTEIARMGASRRDSAFATSTVDLNSAPLSEAEQKDTISGAASVTEESQEQPASESRNATANVPLEQEPGERPVKQPEAEPLKQKQQVAEKKLEEPPEVADLEQQTQQKRQLEAADEARRKQREARNRQIKLEREEKLREARRAAALAAWNKANNEIEWTEESDGEPEYNETQQPTDPGVPENEARSERAPLRLEDEQRFSEQVTQARPLKKTPAATAIAKAPQQAEKPPVSGKDQLKALLFAESRNATATAPLEQEPGETPVKQPEAEHLEQGQQVAEIKLAKPPEVADLEQQTQQKRRLEAADEVRRKQREARNRQIKPEREEKLRETRRAAALAAWEKANNQIEWGEESDDEPEYNETQQPTDPDVPVKITPVATGVAKAPQQAEKPPVSGKDQLKALLLAGRWNSEGKPAVLLPSEVTHCESREQHIKCWSVPQNSSTKQGLALYKVEATLQGFSTGDSFQISYRTLVKLVGGDGGPDSTSDEGRWQVTEHSMKCRFIQSDQIQCRDEKGVTRDYQRSGLKKTV